MNKTTGIYNMEKESYMAQSINEPTHDKKHTRVSPTEKMLKFNESKSLDNLLNICPLGIVSWNKLIGALTNFTIISLCKYLPSLIIPTVNKYILKNT